MQDKLNKIQEELERAHRILQYAEHTGTETEVAYAEGVLDGIQLVLDIISDKK